MLHRYIGRHFSFAARVFEIADRLFEHDVFLGAEFFNQIGGLLEWHAAIVVAIEHRLDSPEKWLNNFREGIQAEDEDDDEYDNGRRSD